MNLFDLVIIGGGPGGYIAAIRATQLGFKTALIEKYSNLGGTCLNVGCIPSKVLLNSSEHYYNAKKTFSSYGIECLQLKLNFFQMIAHKNEIVETTTKGINFLMKKNKISVFNGIASFVNSTQIKILCVNSEDIIINSKYFIIATGSKPTELPFIKIDKERIISSTEILNLKEVPKHLIVIGGGVIGLEFSSVYSRLGSKVTVLEHSDKIVPSMDGIVSKELQKILTKQGVVFKLSHQVEEIKRFDKIITVNALNKNKNNIIFEGDYVLVAIGRSPFTKQLGLNNIGLQVDEIGKIKVNQDLQTDISNIYAIGDVIGGLMLAHKAAEEGIFVVESLSGQNPCLDYNLIPNVIYTHPEVASVGKTEEQLQFERKKYKIGFFNMRALGRARVSMDMDGFVKIISDQETDEVLGCHIISARAADLISEIVIAMQYRASSEDLARICYAHPTFSEAIKEAALDATEQRSLHN